MEEFENSRAVEQSGGRKEQREMESPSLQPEDANWAGDTPEEGRGWPLGISCSAS